MSARWSRLLALSTAAVLGAATAVAFSGQSLILSGARLSGVTEVATGLTPPLGAGFGRSNRPSLDRLSTRNHGRDGVWRPNSTGARYPRLLRGRCFWQVSCGPRGTHVSSPHRHTIRRSLGTICSAVNVFFDIFRFLSVFQSLNPAETEDLGHVSRGLQ